jgi:hypothetical protein
MTGADLIVAILKSQGVPFIATLSGNGLDQLFAACQRGGLRLATTQGATAAQCGSALSEFDDRVIGTLANLPSTSHVPLAARVCRIRSRDARHRHDYHSNQEQRKG